MSPHDVEHFSQVCEMITFVTAFYSGIISIAFYGLTYMLMEDRIHGVLISCTSILQAKRHYYVAVYSQRRLERCVPFILGYIFI